jgi:hypothetical protein
MAVKLADSDADLHRISGVLMQLRPAFDEGRLVTQIKDQRVLSIADLGK